MCSSAQLYIDFLYIGFDFLTLCLVAFPLLKLSLLSCWCSHPYGASLWRGESPASTTPIQLHPTFKSLIHKYVRTTTGAGRRHLFGHPHYEASTPNLHRQSPLQGWCCWGRSPDVFVLGPEWCLLLPYCSFRFSNPTLELAAIVPSSAKDWGARAASCCCKARAKDLWKLELLICTDGLRLNTSLNTHVHTLWKHLGCSQTSWLSLTTGLIALSTAKWIFLIFRKLWIP